MKLLLDTHVFLWAISTPQRIPERLRSEIESLANTINVSAVSVAEIMIKASLGKLNMDFDPNEQIEQAGFEPIDFTGADAEHLKALPFHHRDPFDRMLICQSIERDLPILTLDPAFKQYKCRLA